MRKIGKKVLALLAVAAFSVTSVVGCGVKSSEVVAKVGDIEITAGVANFYARYQQASVESYYAQYYGENFWGMDYSEGVTFEESMKSDVMTAIQELYLVDMHKADYDVALTEEEEKAIDEAATLFVEQNKAKDLKKVSGEKEVVAEVLRLTTIQTKMQKLMVADVDREVSDDEAAQKAMEYVTYSLYTTDESGQSVAMTDDQRAAAKAQAELLADNAKTTDDFAALAETYGLKAETATFDAEATTPSADLVKAADALKEGEVTGVVETDSAYYVAKVTSTFDREATDKKKEEIIAERESAKYTEIMDGWKEEVDIKVFDDVWAKISFADLLVEVKEPKTEDAATDSTTETTETTETTGETAE